MLKNMLAILLFVGGSAASAATLDFAAEADANGERGGAETLVLDGVTVDIDAVNGEAYLDSGNAGLGVCSTGLTNSAQCVQSSDDNIQNGGTLGDEEAILSFEEDTQLESMVVRKANHSYMDEGDTVLVSYDGGATYEQHTVEANGVVELDDTKIVTAGTDVMFKADTALTGDEFYVSSITVNQGPDITTTAAPVPLPAGMVLMLTGLGVIGIRQKLLKRS